jgi:hypothetical protein
MNFPMYSRDKDTISLSSVGKEESDIFEDFYGQNIDLRNKLDELGKFTELFSSRRYVIISTYKL